MQSGLLSSGLLFYFIDFREREEKHNLLFHPFMHLGISGYLDNALINRDTRPGLDYFFFLFLLVLCLKISELILAQFVVSFTKSCFPIQHQIVHEIKKFNKKEGFTASI